MTREDDADQAVRAATDISQAVSKIATTEGSNARCRIGIATGAVAVTNSQVFGDVMNLASRLQQLGAPGDVILDNSTRRICGDAFGFRSEEHKSELQSIRLLVCHLVI